MMKVSELILQLSNTPQEMDVFVMVTVVKPDGDIFLIDGTHCIIDECVVDMDASDYEKQCVYIHALPTKFGTSDSSLEDGEGEEEEICYVL